MAVHELAERGGGGIRVRLLWDSARNQVVLRYRDRREAELFEVDVPNELALTAFEHPNSFRPRPPRRPPAPALRVAGRTGSR